MLQKAKHPRRRLQNHSVRHLTPTSLNQAFLGQQKFEVSYLPAHYFFPNLQRKVSCLQNFFSQDDFCFFSKTTTLKTYHHHLHSPSNESFHFFSFATNQQ